VRVVDTGGSVMPGMLDLHGHPEFNVFAAWEPPRLFSNRYQWRRSELYQQIVRDPQNRLLTALPPQTQLRYAEVRALVGGVTAIQGASGRVRSSAESLVRNVDLNVFGAHRARSAIDLPAGSSRDLPRFQQVIQQIAAGEVTAFYVHLAEGRRDDPRSLGEFDTLVALGGLLIHGAALSRDNFEQVRAAGAKLVVPAEQPAPVRPDHRRQERVGGGCAGRAGRGLAALGQHQPARGDAGRPPGAHRAGRERHRRGVGAHGDHRRGRGRGPR